MAKTRIETAAERLARLVRRDMDDALDFFREGEALLQGTGSHGGAPAKSALESATTAIKALEEAKRKADATAPAENGRPVATRTPGVVDVAAEIAEREAEQRARELEIPTALVPVRVG